MYLNLLIIAMLTALTVTSCNSPAAFDETAARKEIMKLHDLQRTVHFENMPEEFADLLSENHISVNRGVISSPTREENIERFSSYFSAVEFEKWDDLKPPVIRFSDDGSLAYTIVSKEVVLTYENEEKQKVRESVEFSWVAIYKKYQDGWKIDCVASTNLDSEKEIL